MIAVKPRTEIEECFRTLKDNDKWTLTTGTTMEDSLYAFGKLKITDHPSQSLIFDIDDSDSYIKNGVFTEKEIEEIQTYKNLKHEDLPSDFKQYLNKFQLQINCRY